MGILSEFYPIVGGLDLVTPRLTKHPGSAIYALNFEPDPMGCRRIEGYERFDGRLRPSEAQYWVLAFTSGQHEPVVGTVVHGATSSATGKVLMIDRSAGTWTGTDAEGELILIGVDGTWLSGETVKTADGTVVAESVHVPTLAASATDAEHLTRLHAAIDAARADIGVVPGNGKLRGVHVFAGEVYAWRDNAEGTAGGMYKATASGWSLQALGRTLWFTGGGTTEIVAGDTITGSTSHATGVVGKVIVTSGAWATGDAAGRMVLTTQTGSFQNESVDSVHVEGNSTPNSIPPGGRYECVNFNFFGAENMVAMYCVNGVGPAFSWDGAVFVPIITGMYVDVPTHIVAHKNSLFLTFDGGSLQFSGIGDPYSWDVLSGAGEIGIGQDIEGMVSQSTILSVFGMSSTYSLYGNSSADWQLQVLSSDTGAVDRSIQILSQPIFLDGPVVKLLSATNVFGDMAFSILSRSIEPMLKYKERYGVSVISSVTLKRKNQYRVFFSDGTGLVLYMGASKPMFLPIDYGKKVWCICAGKSASGVEELFFGSDDGYIYQLDMGGSFDGEPLEAFIRLAHYYAKRPEFVKRWHKITVDTDAPPTANIKIVADFDLNLETPPAIVGDFVLQGGAGVFSESNYSECYFDSSSESIMTSRIEGTGKNISILFITSSLYDEPFSFNGVTLQFSLRRMDR